MRLATPVCRLAVLASVVMATPMIATVQGNQWVQEATLTAPDGPVGVGVEVAIDGEAVVVGAPRAAVGGNTRQGAAYVHTRVFGTWIPTAQLTASGGADDDWFGSSVAIANDTIVVGARYADVNGKSNQGAVYVFTQTSGIWTQTAVLTTPNGAAGNSFGNAVAIDGNTIVVGSEGSAGYRGTAHVFTEADGAWTEAAILTAPDGGDSGDFFGTSVAIDRGTVVVGAHEDGSDGQGAAYVFTRTEGAWTQTADLSLVGPTIPSLFGWSVAIDGDTAVVGARGGPGENGKAYVFTQTGCAWTETATLAAPSGWDAPSFGKSVAVSGDRVVVGDYGAAEVNGDSDSGAAFLYGRDGNAWTETATLFPTNRVGGAIGDSVAIAGNTAVVRGANAVYVFVRKLLSS